MEKTLKGIVLNSFDFQDYDKIITIYSNLYGKISLVCLGVNKIKSKNKYGINYLSYSNFEIFKSKNKFNLSKLKRSELINSFNHISTDFNLYLYANIITSLVLSLDEQIKNYNLYKTLKLSISIINNKPDLGLKVCVLFMFYFLKIIGNQIDLSKCGFCNSKINPIIAISFTNYCSSCKFCYFDDCILIDNQLSNFINSIFKNDFITNLSQEISTNNLNILTRFTLNYYQDIVGTYTTSMYLLSTLIRFN
ncbi:DNA repair protein RecO [Mycoplasma mycoides]|uniref:DNA repair protein RecO n=1 Tax=Mycoplasma mycoides TaxID=2102 RepID=UPI0022408E73|nr:DNA repair protein RecO [Mycoplasma mycoides]QVK03153.1 DNA repair protein RecO [Mycoplasma mycoides subsp. capri]QVK03969.1 DNA repair protein RecO [Mycoplasma mycoides subsp. capri]